MGHNKVENIDDAELIRQCVADNRNAQEMLYRRFADQMFRVCLTYTDNEEDACDVLQDSFVKIFRSLKNYQHENALGGWIRRIVVNTALELYRKNKRRAEITEEYKYLTDSVINNILANISASEIIKMVNELPSRAAMVFKLYAIEGFGHNDIAERLEISVGTSKSQLNRARCLLSERILKSDGRK